MDKGSKQTVVGNLTVILLRAHMYVLDIVVFSNLYLVDQYLTWSTGGKVLYTCVFMYHERSRDRACF